VSFQFRKLQSQCPIFCATVIVRNNPPIIEEPKDCTAMKQEIHIIFSILRMTTTTASLNFKFVYYKLIFQLVCNFILNQIIDSIFCNIYLAVYPATSTLIIFSSKLYAKHFLSTFQKIREQDNM